MRSVVIAVLAVLATANLAGSAGAAPERSVLRAALGIQQISADEAWAASTGAGQVIAVVDAGGRPEPP